MIDQEQLMALKGVFPNLQLGKEAGSEFIVIRGLPLPAGTDPVVVDGLLCPSPREGYSSRLFLSQKIQHRGRGTNWNASGVPILGSRWWAVSWQTRPGQTLLQMTLDHLYAFRDESQN